MAIRVIGIRQLREELASVMGELTGLGEIVITQRGEGKAVLVDLRRYNDLIERLEYLEDSLDALEGARERAVPLSQLA
jgi:prevent-host-death family protein